MVFYAPYLKNGYGEPPWEHFGRERPFKDRNHSKWFLFFKQCVLTVTSSFPNLTEHKIRKDDSWREEQPIYIYIGHSADLGRETLLP